MQLPFRGTVSLQPYGVVLHRNFSCVQDGKGEQKSIQKERTKKKEGQRKGKGENTGCQQNKSAGRQQEEEIEIQFHKNLSVPSAEPPGFAGFEKIGERQKKRRQGEKLQKDIRPDRQGNVQIQAVKKERNGEKGQGKDQQFFQHGTESFDWILKYFCREGIFENALPAKRYRHKVRRRLFRQLPAKEQSGLLPSRDRLHYSLRRRQGRNTESFRRNNPEGEVHRQP